MTFEVCLPLQCSDRTGRKHLFPQVVLVLAYRTIPAANRFVFTDHDIFCNLVK